MKRPSFQFYPGDWLQDAGLRSCSLAARGLWMDLLCFMHQGTPYGYLSLPAAKDGGKDGGKDGCKDIPKGVIARMVGCDPGEVEGILRELEDAGVFSRTCDGVIFSRRMVQDENLRQLRAAGGVKSLEHPNVPQLKSSRRIPERIPPRTRSDANGGESPSSSSSSSSSNLKTPFNATGAAQIICQANAWSGPKMIWALKDAIEFISKKMPEDGLEQVGEWLVKAYHDHQAAKGKFAVGPLKFFTEGRYQESSVQPALNNTIHTDNPATRAAAQLKSA